MNNFRSVLTLPILILGGLIHAMEQKINVAKMAEAEPAAYSHLPEFITNIIEAYASPWDHAQAYIDIGSLRKTPLDILDLSMRDTVPDLLLPLSDGRIVLGSNHRLNRNREIQIWDITNINNPRRVALQGYGGTIKALMQLADGRLVACSTGGIKIWDISGDERYFGIQFDILCMVSHAIQLAGSKLALGTASGNIMILDLIDSDNLQDVSMWTGHQDGISALMQLDDNRLASGSWDSLIKIWDISDSKSPQCVATLQGHTGTITTIFKLSNNTLISSSTDNTIKFWDISDIEHSRCTATLRGHESRIRALIKLSDGSLASAASDGVIKIWNVSDVNNSRLHCSLQKAGNLTNLTQLSDGRLVSTSDANEMTIWDINKDHRKLVQRELIKELFPQKKSKLLKLWHRFQALSTQQKLLFVGGVVAAGAYGLSKFYKAKKN